MGHFWSLFLVLFCFYVFLDKGELYCILSQQLDLELWHRCFGHLGIDVVKQLINQDMVDSLDLTSDSPFPAI